jgi:hypothetical protein
MTDKNFWLSLRDGKEYQDVEFDREKGDLLHRFDLAIEVLQRFKRKIIEDELDKPFHISIVPEDQRAENQRFGDNEYQNPLTADKIDVPF